MVTIWPLSTPGRDLDLAPLGGAYLAASIALEARIGNRFARAVASIARAHVLNPAEGRVRRHANLARAVASLAGLRASARLRTRAVAGFAGFIPHQIDFLFTALGGFLKAQAHFIANIVATNRAIVPATASGAAAHAAAKEGIENIFKTEAAKAAEIAGICPAASRASAAVHALVPIAVVRRALLGIWTAPHTPR